MTAWAALLAPYEARGADCRTSGRYAEVGGYLRRLGKRWTLTDDCRRVLSLVLDGHTPLHGANDTRDIVARIQGAQEAAFHGLMTGDLQITNRGFTALQRSE